MISHFPGLVQLRLGNDTLKTQIYDLSLSWIGTGFVSYDTSKTQIYDLSLFWLGTVEAW